MIELVRMTTTQAVVHATATIVQRVKTH